MTIDHRDIPVTPRIIPRTEHCISRRDISKAALKVLYRLAESGYDAYLVGGSVRDLLLGGHPKDYDVATNALPDEVRKLFPNSLIIGRRFRLVHVRYGREIVEVATFRGDSDGHVDRQHGASGMILRDNVYGTIMDDASRRDFTVNALYYNVADFSVVDYLNGMHDLEHRQLRVIGDPEERFREDPVRMLRAVRFAAKLNFQLTEESTAVIGRMAEVLRHVSPARLYDELVKITLCGNSFEIYALLKEYHLFEVLFPTTQLVLDLQKDHFYQDFLNHALKDTDSRLEQGKTVNPAFLIAVILWIPLQHYTTEYQMQGLNLFQAMAAAESTVLKEQRKTLSIPRRLILVVRDIWRLQSHLPQKRRSRVFRTIDHPRFRAAYDFLLLRAKSGENVQELCEWWGTFQEATVDEREKMINTRQSKRRRHGKRD